ncbi:MAG: hypothetical protein WCH04_20405 [Gammaproteobacteria bacterium]
MNPKTIPRHSIRRRATIPFRSLIVLFSVSLVGILDPSQSQAEPWPIDQFEVVNIEPSAQFNWTSFATTRIADILRQLRSETFDPDFPKYFHQVELKQSTKASFELALSQAASSLEDWGFPPPKLEPVVRRADGQQAYRIYLVQDIKSGEESVAGVYHYCRFPLLRGETVILLDAKDVLTVDGLVVYSGLSSAIHELFHAVQYNTRFIGGCTEEQPGDWIIEAQATAIEHAIAGRIRGVEQRRMLAEVFGTGAEWIFGLRNYSKRLPVPSTSTIDISAYRTSSFWTFLAEYKFTGGHVKPSGINNVDFSYLAEVMNSPPVARDCAQEAAPCEAEVAWLDARLRAVFGKSLRELYAEFIRAYSLYGNGRLDQSLTPDPLWVNRAFFPECMIEGTRTPAHGVTLRPTTEGFNRQLTLKKFNENAAQCWNIVPLGFKDDIVKIAATVEQFGIDPAIRLDQLTATLADGSKYVRRAEVERPPGSNVQRARWIFPVKVGYGTLFLLTNMADSAETTKKLMNLSVTFTALKEYASMGENTADMTKLASDIDAPLPVKFDKFSASLHPGHLGPGFTRPVTNPCLLRLSGRQDRKPGEMHAQQMQIMMQLEGPLEPTSYSLFEMPSSGSGAEMLPPGRAVASLFLTDAPGDQKDFQLTSGELVIDSVDFGLVRGHLTGLGVHKVYSQTTMQYEIAESRNLAIKFSIFAQSGIYSDNPNVCAQ